MVTKIHNNDMSEIQKQDLAVIDFSATWCGPCQMLAPVLDQLDAEMEDVAFYNIDSDENMDLARQFMVSSIPAIYVMKRGEVVGSTVGFQPAPTLKAWIESNR